MSVHRPILALAAALSLSGCAAALSTHPVAPVAPPPAAATSSAMIDAMRRPGQGTFEAITAADWRFQYVSADARQTPREWVTREMDARILFYAWRHPRHGLILFDAGVPEDATDQMGPILRRVLAMDRTLVLRRPTGRALAVEAPRAVFLTHLHYDHVLGVRDLPRETPIHVGPGEGAQRHFLYRFIAPVTARALRGRPALHEWRFDTASDGRLAALDVFGDASVFAIHAPGHTPGSTAYLVNAADGPHLITGDAVQSREAWTGERLDLAAFEGDRDRLWDTVRKLRALAAAIPGVTVHLGHQDLPVGVGGSGKPAPR